MKRDIRELVYLRLGTLRRSFHKAYVLNQTKKKEKEAGVVRNCQYFVEENRSPVVESEIRQLRYILCLKALILCLRSSIFESEREEKVFLGRSCIRGSREGCSSDREELRILSSI